MGIVVYAVVLIAAFASVLYLGWALGNPPLQLDPVDIAEYYPCLQGGVQTARAEDIRSASEWLKNHLDIRQALPIELSSDNSIKRDGLIRGWVGLEAGSDADWARSEESPGVLFVWDLRKGRVRLGEDKAWMTNRLDVGERIIEMVAIQTVRKRCRATNIQVVPYDGAATQILGTCPDGKVRMWLVRGDLRDQVELVPSHSASR